MKIKVVDQNKEENQYKNGFFFGFGFVLCFWLLLGFSVSASASSLDAWFYGNPADYNADICEASYVSSTVDCESTLAANTTTTMITSFTGEFSDLIELKLDTTSYSESYHMYFRNPYIISGDCTQDGAGVDIGADDECVIGWNTFINSDSYSASGFDHYPFVIQSGIEAAFPYLASNFCDSLCFNYIYKYKSGSTWYDFDPDIGPFPVVDEEESEYPVFNIYPTSPINSTTTIVDGGDLKIEGTYDFESWTPSTTVVRQWVMNLYDLTTNDLKYTIKFYPSSVGQTGQEYAKWLNLANGDYYVIYKSVEYDLTISATGIPSITMILTSPPDNLSGEATTTVISVTSSDYILPEDQNGELPDISADDNVVSQWISEQSNKFVDFLQSRFPINYIMPWFGILDNFAWPATSSPYSFALPTGNGTTTVTTTIDFSSFAATEINLGGEVQTLGYWSKLAFDIYVIWGFCWLGWKFFSWLTAPQKTNA